MRLAAVVLTVGLLSACTDSPGRTSPTPASPSATTSTAAAPSPVPSPVPSTSAAPAPSPSPEPLPRVSPDDLRVGVAVETVDHLAGAIGPRPGHTAAYFRAAAWAERRLASYGWTVERQRFPTPAGVSWGVPVEGGPSVNLVATRGDLVPGAPWLLVGAHLDTVPQAPGAEDNASGVGTVLAVAEALEGRRTRLPVVLALFGSEEPRGEGDAHHHYGSRAYVAALDRSQRRSLAGMVSLDRVGVGDVVPVGSAGERDAVSDALATAARRARVPIATEPGQRSSDHWSFVRAGMPAARLGSTPYPGYHSAGDVPSVVDPAQLRRVGRLMLSWLR